jgi:hypothetical protein
MMAATADDYSNETVEELVIRLRSTVGQVFRLGKEIENTVDELELYTKRASKAAERRSADAPPYKGKERRR